MTKYGFLDIYQNKNLIQRRKLLGWSCPKDRSVMRVEQKIILLIYQWNLLRLVEQIHNLIKNFIDFINFSSYIIS